MTASYADRIRLEGIGPSDFDDPVTPLPSVIIINVIRPELCDDGEIHDVRTWREFPLYASKAAQRWADYCGRKYGKGNVWEEIW